jgi:hypothetical protein
VALSKNEELSSYPSLFKTADEIVSQSNVLRTLNATVIGHQRADRGRNLTMALQIERDLHSIIAANEDKK